MAIVEIMGILNFDDDVQFWYTITVLLPLFENLIFFDAVPTIGPT